MTIKEACKAVKQYNDSADRLNPLCDGGRRAVLYIVQDVDGQGDCIKIDSAKDAKRLFCRCVSPALMDAIMEYDFAHWGEFYTITHEAPLGAGAKWVERVTLCLSAEVE